MVFAGGGGSGGDASVPVVVGAFDAPGARLCQELTAPDGGMDTQIARYQPRSRHGCAAAHSGDR